MSDPFQHLFQPELADVIGMQAMLDGCLGDESPVHDDRGLGAALAAWSQSAKQALSGISYDAACSGEIASPRAQQVVPSATKSVFNR